MPPADKTKPPSRPTDGLVEAIQDSGDPVRALASVLVVLPEVRAQVAATKEEMGRIRSEALGPDGAVSRRLDHIQEALTRLTSLVDKALQEEERARVREQRRVFQRRAEAWGALEQFLSHAVTQHLLRGLITVTIYALAHWAGLPVTPELFRVWVGGGVPISAPASTPNPGDDQAPVLPP